MPQAKRKLPALSGVNSTVVLSNAARVLVMPKSGNTIRDEQSSASLPVEDEPKGNASLGTDDVWRVPTLHSYLHFLHVALRLCTACFLGPEEEIG